MAQIKSYTDLEQSKKLAEILPLESADMCYLQENGQAKTISPAKLSEILNVSKPQVIPCWSLAALLGVLPKIGSEEPMIQKLYYANNPKERYICMYAIDNISSEYNNPVDACYEMIIKLKEQDLL